MSHQPEVLIGLSKEQAAKLVELLGQFSRSDAVALFDTVRADVERSKEHGAHVLMPGVETPIYERGTGRRATSRLKGDVVMRINHHSARGFYASRALEAWSNKNPELTLGHKSITFFAAAKPMLIPMPDPLSKGTRS